MTDADAPSRYAVPLDDLVRTARVPLDEQTSGQPTRVPEPEPDEERRQLRLAGGG